MIRLKDLRLAMGLNQQQCAASLGIAQPTLSGWETGKSQIDYDNLIKLSKFFNVSIDYLLGNSDAPNPPDKDRPVILPAAYPKDIMKLAEQIQALPIDLRMLVEQQLRVYAKMQKDLSSTENAE